MAGMLVACAFGSSQMRADTVTQWNVIMEATVTAAPSNPVIQTRWGAIVQLAVFEAVNSITGDYEPYLGAIDAPEGASIEAAAIVAAYDTLAGLRPTVVASFGLEAIRDADLAAIADGDAKDNGIAVGQAAAAAMLALRAADGSTAVATYDEEPGPGVFQPLPGQSAFLPGWGMVTPFALADASQFRLPPPPRLNTGKYANAYNEVKLLGRIDSPYRSQDRTDVARLYAAASPVQIFNSAARQVSAAQELTLSQNARLFAQLGMAMADAAIACWETKYTYDFWRPQAAIRAGDIDGNNHTQADPEWLPLITTPAHPSYASGHATVSGAAVAVLRHTFGKGGHAITISHSSLPGIVLNYTAWEQMTADVDDARIYGGIHFRFDQDFGAKQGHAVGMVVLENTLRSEQEIAD
ncbi:MAG: vanadium-dependent haloperoxidase [Aureliella sp.]